MPTIDLNRANLSACLIGKINVSERCLSVSAPNNFGKSHFLRQLVATSALNRREEEGSPLLIYVDCNLRADDTQQALYELVLKELMAVFNSSELLALYSELAFIPVPQPFSG